MIRIRRRPLPALVRTGLADYQTTVDGQVSYAARVEAARQHFSLRNKKTNAVFRSVRQTLTQMCHGARRCMYCEDAPADEVEHFRPKNLYPEFVFTWPNYLYACGICNGPKNNKWGLLARTGSAVSEAARGPASPVMPPPKGYPALIDPSREDPLRYLFLDLQSFVIVPMPGNSGRDLARAKYTIEILDLNKDFLLESRESAHDAYVSHLKHAETIKAAGSPIPPHLRDAVRRTHHPTVWAEMRRQRESYALLRRIFAAIPEALIW